MGLDKVKSELEKFISEPITLEEAIKIGMDTYNMMCGWFSVDNPPTEYGRYEVCRKDGKMHYETWNGRGWAYNGKSIVFWRHIMLPPEFKHYSKKEL